MIQNQNGEQKNSSTAADRQSSGSLDFLRRDRLPHVWCPGCGNGVLVKSALDAVRKLGLNKDDVAVIGGIGCSGRTPFILDFNTMHTTHGRALAFATGLKLVRPMLNVLVTMGDGDAVGIGGNHFIHSCRRNIDMTAIVFNNSIYGQTGGQLAPTTPQDARSATSVYGNIEPNFDITELALAAGSTFVARTTTFDPRDVSDCIMQAVQHKGFSVVEVLTTCPTYFGRMNRVRDPYDMVHMLNDTSLSLDELHSAQYQLEQQLRSQLVTAIEAENLSPRELDGKIITGIFRQAHRVEYGARYRELIRRAKENGENG